MASLLIRHNQQILRNIRLYSADLKMGRSSECEIQLSDPEVSRKHARITLVDGLYFLEDLGSRSGIFLNGEKIQRAQ